MKGSEKSKQSLFDGITKYKYIGIPAALIIVGGLLIFYMRYLSFTKYNIHPLKEYDRYLQETYYGDFKGKVVGFYIEDGYYVWKLKYIDGMGVEFDDETQKLLNKGKNEILNYIYCEIYNGYQKAVEN